MILDHPPVNAFDSSGWFAIASEIESLGRRDEVRVIIIASEGRGFCAGVDIKELAADASKILDVNRGNYATFKAIHLNPLPVIIGLHGFVLGGGIGMAGAADFRRIPFKTLKVEQPEGRQLYECDLALIRPDQHVAWRVLQPWPPLMHVVQ